MLTGLADDILRLIYRLNIRISTVQFGSVFGDIFGRLRLSLLDSLHSGMRFGISLCCSGIQAC